MAALGRGDYGKIKSLFCAQGHVVSPFLGQMPASAFFDEPARASTRNVITPISLFVSATDEYLATAYFQYDWTVGDGTLVTFKVMDLFTFEPISDKISRLELIYDTYPIRTLVGNKYET